MEPKTIKHEHNVVHYLSNRKIDNKSGKVRRHAFRLRQGENGLSVNWLEFFTHLPKYKQLEEVQYSMLQTDYKLRESGVLAELNVGATILAIYEEHKIKIRVIHAPSKHNHCHALILGLPSVNDHDKSRAVSRSLAELADKHRHKVTITKKRRS